MTTNPEYRCETCGEEFDGEIELRDHVQLLHSGYECEICGKVFVTQDELNTHISETHPENEEIPNP